ncbi:hypothetical protein HanPSC8_Chr04g0156671 [Helianthus annuus]|nr:hypothetical protein HanPSC8_Chr04g0156671 [Helianthus annuus]
MFIRCPHRLSLKNSVTLVLKSAKRSKVFMSRKLGQELHIRVVGLDVTLKCPSFISKRAIKA